MDERQNKLSLLIPEMQRIVTRISRRIAAGETFRLKGVLGEVFETKRTVERQKQLVKDGKSFTMNSYHLNGLAADIVLTNKGLIGNVFKVIKYLWNDPLYDQMTKIMVEEGLRSLGETHDFDYYHGELPLIFQGTDPYCFAYVVINALQKASPVWRLRTKKYCYMAADKIAETVKSERRLQSVESALNVAHEKGWIKGWTKIDRAVWEDKVWWSKQNKRPLIISQKRRSLGGTEAERWNKQLKRMENGLGVAGHTVLFGFANSEGIHVRNSYETYPTYILNSTDEIMSVYDIIL